MTKTLKIISNIVIIVIMIGVLTGALVYFNVIDKLPADNPSQGDNPPPNTDDPDLVVGNKVGNLCYTYDMRNVFDEGTTNIENLRGKVVVINFWGTWCGPCKAELPYFNSLANEFEEEVAVIAVHTSLNENTAALYLNTNYPDTKMIAVFDDENTSTMIDVYYRMLGGYDTYPMTIIIDANGVVTHRIVKSIHSYDELRGYALEAMA